MTRALTLESMGRRMDAERARARVLAWTRYQAYNAADAIVRAVVSSKR
jgi:hypothetical protein